MKVCSSSLKEICLTGAALMHADRQKERRTGVTNLIGSLQDCVNVRKLTVAGQVLGKLLYARQPGSYLSVQHAC
jgi:hypothetical protein